MSDSFGTRLRYERERRQIELKSIAEGTKINIALLEGLERGDVSRWPSGIFRKAFVRSYAQAIGLDPDQIAREFLELYPDPLELPVTVPEQAVPDAAAVPAPNRLMAQLNQLRPLAARMAELKTAVLSRRSPDRSSESRPLIVKLTIVPPNASFKRGKFLEDARQRGLAAACDAGVTCVLALGFFGVFDQFWTPLGVSLICYYLGSVLVLGNTPGVCLFAPAPAPAEPMQPESRLALEMDLDEVHVPAETFIYR